MDGSCSLWRRQDGCGGRPKYVRPSGSVAMVLVAALFLPETFVCIKFLYVLKPLKISSYAPLSKEGHLGIVVNTDSEAFPSS